jgi:Cu2+-exporting ATPase
VPVVQVVATGRLLRRGILVKSATALERLAAVDTVVFDKTGTLTLGAPALQDVAAIPVATLRRAAALARASRHPLARALAAAAPDVPATTGVNEHPGQGLSVCTPLGEVRLGSRRFCGVAADARGAADGALELWWREEDGDTQRFAFADQLREDASAVVGALAQDGYAVSLISGDRPAAVARVASEVRMAAQAGSIPPARLPAWRRCAPRAGTC